MMNLEQATERVAAAVAAQDIEAIDAALEARAHAIAELAGATPSRELETRLTAAIEAGEAIHRNLSAIKLQIGFEGARLAQLEAGFAAGIRRRPAPCIDYRG
jgi:hypothetical protein